MLKKRPRRNRNQASLRELVQENRLHPSDIVSSLFIIEGNKIESPIESLPGISRYTIDLLLKEVECQMKLGICAVDLFPVVPDVKKDPYGSEAVREGNLLQQAVCAIKKEFPELTVMVDVALDPYSSHGHDGLVNDKGEILNDETLEVLSKMALFAAEAGADIVAPSDMMDGRVAALRSALDEGGWSQVGILSYSAKYASSFYGPFRDALGSSPKFGDKNSYQLNPANCREALLEAELDIAEGADLLLVKPALAYLDVLAKIKEITCLPVGAYHVSGEYAMIMAADQRGWIDGDRALFETHLAMKRAGADFILSYGAKKLFG